MPSTRRPATTPRPHTDISAANEISLGEGWLAASSSGCDAETVVLHGVAHCELLPTAADVLVAAAGARLRRAGPKLISVAAFITMVGRAMEAGRRAGLRSCAGESRAKGEYNMT